MRDVERVGRVRTAVSGLETWRISEIMLLPHWRTLNHVFGGGSRTAAMTRALKARQHTGAATPEAPRTRKNQARPARSKLFATG